MLTCIHVANCRLTSSGTNIGLWCSAAGGGAEADRQVRRGILVCWSGARARRRVSAEKPSPVDPIPRSCEFCVAVSKLWQSGRIPNVTLAFGVLKICAAVATRASARDGARGAPPTSRCRQAGIVNASLSSICPAGLSATERQLLLGTKQLNDTG